MERRKVNKDGRKKAFIGAIVGTVAGIAGSVISAKAKAKAEEAAYKEAQATQNRSDGLNQAANLTNQYANQDYVDNYKKKITLKNGGKVKVNSNDRITMNKKFAAGGRKRFAEGGGMDLVGEAAGAAGGIGSLVTSLLVKPKAPKTVKKADGFNYGAPKTTIDANSYQVDELGNPVTAMNTIGVVDDDQSLNRAILPKPIARMGKRVIKSK